jgi:hypothetical protein
MRSLRLAAIAFLALATFLTFTGSALANSAVDIQLTGVGGNNAGGVYTYPYYFSVSGGAPIAMICDSYDNRVSIGESWKAYKVGLLSGKGLFGNELLDYKAAGLMFKSILNGTLNANVGNFAIWSLFSTNVQYNGFFQSNSTLLSNLDNYYLGLARTDPNSAYNGLFLYTPIKGTQSANGMPQEYIGYSPVPEPISVMLFGTGMLALAGAVRTKLRETQA